jgi:hypothetical protein
MAVETSDMRSILLADFGESVTYIGADRVQKTITAIFDNQYNGLDAGGTVEVSVVQPRLTVRTEDVPSLDHGDTFVVRNVQYETVVIMPDGTGITEVALEEQ